MNWVKLLLATLLFGVILVEGTPQSVFRTSNNVLAPGLNSDWWQTAVLYQIYPRSFKDSDNDGIGDLLGIIQKLDHLKDMGVDAVWLSPVYKSPQVDNGYDITDFKNIDPIFGTLDDLRQLIDEAHKLNIKVLMDYVPNHTSDQHEWFQASLKRDPKYDNYFIWRNATYVNGERKPPNNWLSWFKDSAWEWNEERQQYYLHQFSIDQPDLNFRNSDVAEEMKDVLKYWLNFGIDGFRMDAVGTLFEDILFRDEPESGTSGVDPNDHHFLNHTYTVDQPETFDMIYQWRDLLDEFTRQNQTYTRVMITEGTGSPDQFQFYYGSADGSRLGAHFTFNFITFFMIHLNYTSSELYRNIQTWFNNIPQQYTNNWVLGNHDEPRVSTRLGVKNIDALNMLASILPGAQVTYQGEEIGQENGEVTCEEGQDPKAIKNCSTFDTVSRDFERTPFQWDNSTNAGFNDGAKPWLPISTKYVETNLAKQNVSGINSHYNIYKQMLKLRQEFRNTTSDEIAYGIQEGNTIFFAQRITDNANYTFYYNVGDSEEKIWLIICTDCLSVSVRSINSEYIPGDTLNVSQPLKPGEAILARVGV